VSAIEVGGRRQRSVELHQDRSTVILLRQSRSVIRPPVSLGNDTFTIEYLYDAAGFLRTENGCSLSNGQQYSSIDYQYHPDGRLEEKRDSDDGVRVSMTYNDQNQLILTTGYFSFSDPFTHQFEHVPNSDFIRQVGRVDQTGASINGFTVFNRDDNGNVISTVLFDADGNPTSIDRYFYERSPEPMYNYWLHIFRFFPEDARTALLGL